MKVRSHNSGKIFTIDINKKPHFTGGEGAIYEIPTYPELFAKIYKGGCDQNHIDKLSLMINNPPISSKRKHPYFAWPKDLLLDVDTRKIVGFLMPRIHNAVRIFEYYNTDARKHRSMHISYKFLVQVAQNLAIAVEKLHKNKSNVAYVVGDINESNILVSGDMSVSIVDTDSIQVTDLLNNKIYRCTVGRIEYTPPELQGRKFSEIDRTIEHDSFSLAILIFLLLMEGNHPFAGVHNGSSDISLAERMRQGLYAFDPRTSEISPPRLAPPIEMLHPKLQELFMRCFINGHTTPSERPTAFEWNQALHEALKNLTVCNENENHYYWTHYSKCIWCELRKQREGRDPFPSDQPKTIVKSSSRGHSKQTSGLSIVQTIIGYKSAINDLDFSPCGKFIAGCDSTSIKIHRISDGVPVCTFKGHTDWVRSVAFSPDGQLIASGSDDHTIKLWRVSGGSLVHTLEGHTDWVRSVAFSPDGQLIASGSDDHTIKLWRVSGGSLVHTLEGHTDWVRSVAFSPDGQLIASGSRDKTVRLWRVSSRQPFACFEKHRGSVNSVYFSINRSLSKTRSLASTSARKPSVDCSLSEVLLATCGDDQTVKVWQVYTKNMIHDLEGHKNWVNMAVFSPDGRFIASASDDNTIMIWCVQNGSRLHTVRAHSDAVNAVVFSRNGQLIASASEDRTIKVWQFQPQNP